MTNGITLLCGAHLPPQLVFQPIAAIVGHGHTVFVLDGENSFRSYAIAQQARRLNLSPQNVLTRVQISRAFTCYQLAELVTRGLNDALSADGAALVCLGLLGTFHDEDVPQPEARRLLAEVVAHLKRLATHMPILITVRPPPPAAHDRMGLIRFLMQHADAIRMLESETRLLPTQTSLSSL